MSGNSQAAAAANAGLMQFNPYYMPLFQLQMQQALHQGKKSCKCWSIDFSTKNV